MIRSANPEVTYSSVPQAWCSHMIPEVNTTKSLANLILPSTRNLWFIQYEVLVRLQLKNHIDIF